MFCLACNAPARLGDRFCAKCGCALNQTPALPPLAKRRVIGRPSELKLVTALRCDIVASTKWVSELSPEDALDALKPALGVMRQAVRLHLGIVCRELGDGILAVFGAPQASDNHATAALYAAFHMLHEMRVQVPKIQIRIGVHSATVITHLISTEYSSIYDIGGPALNLVERLQTVAEPNTILASDACRALSEGFVTFDSPVLRELKGFAKPVFVSRAVKVAELSRWQIRVARATSPFVGRTDELVQLAKIASEIGSHHRTCVQLIGEPGVGKSRLAHECLTRLRADGWRVVEAECDSIHAMTPYAALRRLFESATAAGPQEVDMRTTVDALSDASRLAVQAVIGGAIDDSWQRLTPKLRNQAIAKAWCDVLGLLAHSGRTVVLIEDAHWLDQVSGEVLKTALAKLPPTPVLTLLTSRNSAIPSWIAATTTISMQLEALEVSAAAAMLKSLLGPAGRSPSFESRVLHHTGRIPLFIEEVCRQVIESTPALESGELYLSDAAEVLGVPPTIQGVIAARMDRLAATARYVVQVASVFGSDCPTALLRSLGVDEATLAVDLATLAEAGILLPEDSVTEALRFPHDLIRQVAYESMLSSTRADLHGKALLAYEALEGATVERHATLCHHALRAKVWPKAFFYAREVARRCVERSALAEAVAHTEIALDALDRMPMSELRERDAIDFRIEARMALAESGNVERMLSAAREAAERAEAIGDSARAISARAVHSAALNFYGDAFQAVDAGERVVRQAEELGDVGWLNYSQYGLGQAYFMAGRYRAADQQLGCAYDQLDSADARAVAATTTVDLQLICAMMLTLTNVGLGALARAERFQQRTSELATQTSKAYGHVAAGYGRGVYLLGIGDLAQAIASLEATLAFAKQSDVTLFVPVLTCQLGVALLECSRVEAAASALAEATAGARKIGHVSADLRASLNHGLAVAAIGRTGSGLRLARKATDAAAKGGYAAIEAEGLMAQARIYELGRRPQTTKAVALLESAIALASRLEAWPIARKAQACIDRVSRPTCGTSGSGT